MKRFPMCPSCRSEYENPEDRRYHAQPISCYECGPTLNLADASGRLSPRPLESAVEVLKRGEVLAVKGMGGIIWPARPMTRPRFCACAG